MNQANYIRNRLSLRKPQEESLNILGQLSEILSLNKEADLESELAKVRDAYPHFQEFERDFPNFCFALATGVGKTRLMGAFITYLHKVRGIKNFMILSPNLTIYKKLKEDFSDPSCPKYVFRGIDVFAMKKPRIVAGDEDDWSKGGQLTYESSDVTIYIFNIAKVVKDEKSGKIRRMQEYLGDSFFNHLVGLTDLVLLMDESHHYRAKRGHEVINEIKPVLGLEVTATPRIESEKRDFKNVIYQYSLGLAMQDGFVKEPAVATRKDLDTSNMSKVELDQHKLIDGLKIHEDTKNALETYRLNKGKEPVYPFVLVVAQSTNHAAEIKAFIQSEEFFEGNYADKVMEIHSNQRGGEKDENIQKLVALEQDDSVEIVIHVNMLKEGWDVTNLYTIIPLRASASITLTEQTLGRGLRLPYGKRTGDLKVDRLTIVAHDHFDAIIQEANKPDSMIRKENIIDIGDFDLTTKTITPSPTKGEARVEEEMKKATAIADPQKRQKALLKVNTRKAVQRAFFGKINAKNLADLKKPEVKAKIIERVTAESEGQISIDQPDIKKMVEEILEEETLEFIAQTIEIPRVTIVPKGEVKHGFDDFDFQPGDFKPQPVSEEILVTYLRQGQFADEMVVTQGGITLQSLAAVIVNELINEDEINYAQEANLLFKLAGQAIEHFKSYLPDDPKALNNVVYYRKRDIAKEIFAQMKEYEYTEYPAELTVTEVRPFIEIKKFHALTSAKGEAPKHFSETVPKRDIQKYLFRGFSKSCHELYKFHSTPEKQFAAILESEVLGKEVQKWLRPAEGQFHIYWNHNSNRYDPDFVVETAESIYLVEVKRADQVGSDEVKDKARAALVYCKQATEYTLDNGGKAWKYLLIPDDKIGSSTSFEGLAGAWEKNQTG